MAEDTPLDKKKRMTTRWIPDEEKFLAMAYLKISEKNGQHANAFWNRLVPYFQQNTSFAANRTKDQITSKWTDMNKKLGKFNDIITNLKNECETGQPEEDILPLALTRYKQEFGRDFGLWHVWIMLKDSPKWKTPVVTEQFSKNKRLKTSKSGVCATSPHAISSVKLEVEDEAVEVEHPPGFNSKPARQDEKSKAVTSSAGSKVIEAYLQKEIVNLENRSNEQPDKDVSFREFHESVLRLTSLELEKQEDKDFRFLVMDTSNLTGIDLELVLKRKDRIREKYASKYGL